MYNPYNQQNQYNQNPYNQYNRSGYFFLQRGCSLLFGVVLLLLSLVLVIYLHFQTQPVVPDLSGQSLTTADFTPTLVALGAAMSALFGILLLIGWRGRRFLGKVVSTLFVLAIVAGIAVYAFWSFFINPNIGMTRTGFTRTSVSADNGSSLHFQNPANGVTQILCIGVDQHCQPAQGAPAELNHGITVAPGQTVTITFDTDGNYTITSVNTPHMNIHISITTPDDSGD